MEALIGLEVTKTIISEFGIPVFI
ncbi:hypothetical protein RB653_007939 [Dictyostelium firmibasis]|uniref:Uncharacterized protein n=1 Tax=Dictyostelium firmibasis TaxID=79012 RepID=A0AAN7U1Z4_9MYCE